MKRLSQDRRLEQRLDGLRRSWCARAEEFAEHHCDDVAAAYRLAAEDVERELRAWSREPLTIEEAAAETGYSPEHLRRLVRHDKLLAERGEGAKSHLRVQRGHLPAKSLRRGGIPEPGPGYNPDEDARDIAKRLGGGND